MLAAPRLPAQQPAFTLSDSAYFTARGADVLVFSNWYSGLFSDSKLSGVELIHHGVRTATNGDVRLSNTPEQWDPIPTMVSRDVDRAAGRVVATLAYPDYRFTYRVDAQAEGAGVVVRVLLDAPLPAALEGRAGFNLEFLPVAYFGHTFAADSLPGLFPREASGPMARDTGARFEAQPLARGASFVLAPEDAERRVTITSRSGQVALYDGRNRAQNGWFVLRGLLPAGRTGAVLEWLITPNRVPGWTRRPVIAHSQVGYAPSQPKVAVIERDQRDPARPVARLLRVAANGALAPVLAAAPVPWGRWLRYDYARFDFSRVQQPGTYVLEYGSERSDPFVIGDDALSGALWHNTLDTFFPVQMDHVFVRDRYRVWHGVSHLDDARQAPPGHAHFDLYAQGPTTDTRFAGGEHIPELNVGGWFDAGDFDLRTQSEYATVLTLVQVRETFGLDWDETTVHPHTRSVVIRQPDGVPDVVQQVAHGARFLLAQYRAFGHAIPGIVEPVLGQYTHLGDASTKTDNLVFDATLDTSAVRGGFSGRPDDRWAFTSRNSALDYGAMAALAAASRVLGGFDDSLAAECRATAIRVWDEEHARPPATFRSGNTTGGPLLDEELRAAVELLITTEGGRPYAERIAALWPDGAASLENVATTARALPYMSAAFRRTVELMTGAWKIRLDSELARNPFGVPIGTGGWGGNGQVLGFALRMDVLHRAFPAIIGPEYTLRGLDFILGTHPASSTSFVSGVGARSKTIAYGSNRADYTFIPGGVVPGLVIVHPDLPESKDDWPFLWFENEYVIPTAAQYLYVALAAAALVR